MTLPISQTTHSLLSPLDTIHREAGARMIDFAGWMMPVQYKGIREEHRAVRESAGIFDISHMGEIFVSGERASSWLESLLCNRLGKLAVTRGQYTLMLNDEGGVIDDLIIYRTSEKEFFLVINAGRQKEDLSWLTQHLPKTDDIVMNDQSSDYAAFALQGPRAEALLSEVLPEVVIPQRNGIAVIPSFRRGLVARTGYTGEDGFEIFVHVDDVAALWKKFVATGAIPCGLGARDTLRLEMGYPLNGSDLSMTRTPLEAGLEKFVALNDPLKPDFIGRSALEEQRTQGIKFRLTPIKLLEIGPPLRAHYAVYSNDELLGETTSGALSPSLSEGIALAYLPVKFTSSKTPLDIEVRGRRFKAEVTTLPFYKKNHNPIPFFPGYNGHV